MIVRWKVPDPIIKTEGKKNDQIKIVFYLGREVINATMYMRNKIISSYSVKWFPRNWNKPTRQINT